MGTTTGKNAPSPRDLDPTFKDETVTPADLKEPRPNEAAPETEKDPRTREPKAPNVTDDVDEKGSQIVYRQPFVNPETGVTEVKEHGPMPVSEWADYEKEHKL